MLVSKVTRASGGVVEYKTAESFTAKVADAMLVGLVQAAETVSIDESGNLAGRYAPAAKPATADALSAALENATANGGREAFCAQFRELNLKDRSMFKKDAVSFYANPVDSASGDNTWSRAETNWAWNATRRAPSALAIDCPNNICRAMGAEAHGVTSPYSYVGGTTHFFDLHFEECGQAAVNVHVVFETTCGEEPTLSNTSTLRQMSPGVALFWAAHARGLDAVRVMVDKASKKGKRKRQLKLPQRMAAAAMAVGFKRWYIFEGGTADTIRLAEHIRLQLGVPLCRAPGIRPLQHWRPAPGSSVTLDPENLPQDLQLMFFAVDQFNGAVVYTDTRLHFGRGICSINAAWNMLPAGVMQRDCTELGECSPVVFMETAAKLARRGVRVNAVCNAPFGSVEELMVMQWSRWATRGPLLGLSDAVFQSVKTRIRGYCRDAVTASEELGVGCRVVTHAEANYLVDRAFTCSMCGGPVWNELGYVLSSPQHKQGNQSKTPAGYPWLCVWCATRVKSKGTLVVHACTFHCLDLKSD